MVERPELAVALALLARMDASFLRQACCWFAGGTAISLRCGGFRVSRDIDFLCSSREGYRLLRQRLFERGERALFPDGIALVRDIRVDRYGARLVVALDGQPIKLELVSEGRIDLEGVDDISLPVARLSDADLVAGKLLANEDRYLDDAALGRDAIDLILLEHTLGGLPPEAWDKARQAYGPSVEEAWNRALRRLQARHEQRARWLDQMSLSLPARAIIEERLAALPPLDEG